MSDMNQEFNKIIYRGGLQKLFPKNNTELYSWNVKIDAAEYCLKDFSSRNLNENEMECLKNYHFKNQVLMKLH